MEYIWVEMWAEINAGNSSPFTLHCTLYSVAHEHPTKSESTRTRTSRERRHGDGPITDGVEILAFGSLGKLESKAKGLSIAADTRDSVHFTPMKIKRCEKITQILQRWQEAPSIPPQETSASQA